MLCLHTLVQEGQATRLHIKSKLCQPLGIKGTGARSAYAGNTKLVDVVTPARLLCSESGLDPWTLHIVWAFGAPG